MTYATLNMDDINFVLAGKTRGEAQRLAMQRANEICGAAFMEVEEHYYELMHEWHQRQPKPDAPKGFVPTPMHACYECGKMLDGQADGCCSQCG